MQEFLKSNLVNCNLMSLTGYRTLILLTFLMESPRSNEEINACFLNNQYIREKFSVDTIRIYINSLRAIGCEITRANKANNWKYELKSHPFSYDVPKSQLSAISKLYKSFYEKIEVIDVIKLEGVFRKLSSLVQNENTKVFLNNLSLLKNIDESVLKDLIVHCKNKNQIVILYDSPKSGKKEIEIIADKLLFKVEKLYFWGDNLSLGQHSYFRVEKILEIPSIRIKKNEEKFPLTRVVYELFNHSDYIPLADEKILEVTDEKLTVEINAKNDFSIMQKILYYAEDCKVIYPLDFKNRLLEKLKLMKENYDCV